MVDVYRRGAVTILLAIVPETRPFLELTSIDNPRKVLLVREETNRLKYSCSGNVNIRDGIPNLLRPFDERMKVVPFADIAVLEMHIILCGNKPLGFLSQLYVCYQHFRTAIMC